MRMTALACGVCARAAAAQEAQRPLRIVASFSILADLISNVGGPSVAVHALVGPNADAHAFEPTPADAKRVANADLVVVNGLNFEGWMPRLLQAAGYRGRLLVATENIVPRRVHGVPDPHAWQDLANARVYVDNIRAALIAIAPQDAAGMDGRARIYRSALDDLDRRTRLAFDAIPRAQRRVITAHDAFGYFGAAYGVDFLAPQGWSTDGEPTAAAVAALIRQLREQRVRAVFLENITDPRLVQQLAREGGGVVGGTLYSDALSPRGTAADTYLGMFRQNVDMLSAALQR